MRSPAAEKGGPLGFQGGQQLGVRSLAPPQVIWAPHSPNFDACVLERLHGVLIRIKLMRGPY